MHQDKNNRDFYLYISSQGNAALRNGYGTFRFDGGMTSSTSSYTSLEMVPPLRQFHGI